MPGRDNLDPDPDPDPEPDPGPNTKTAVDLSRQKSDKWIDLSPKFKSENPRYFKLIITMLM